jgi:hypothetical protein
MNTTVDERLRREARRFALRFTCEFCLHFDDETRACANGYPTEPHRGRDLESLGQLMFCKMFEMC